MQKQTIPKKNNRGFSEEGDCAGGARYVVYTSPPPVSADISAIYQAVRPLVQRKDWLGVSTDGIVIKFRMDEERLKTAREAVRTVRKMEQAVRFQQVEAPPQTLEVIQH